MVIFNSVIQKFNEKGEKTGWSYIEVSSQLAGQLKPRTKQIFRVKGKLDHYKITGVALMPLGKGNYILPFNAAMRKGTGKTAGDELHI